ncbi:hypothetical protein KAI58_01825 [Candidatus Gracilibacteria bacterium]|nr:hypothetical protein [Candidatus Gracilibacteria bacterium]
MSINNNHNNQAELGERFSPEYFEKSLESVCDRALKQINGILDNQGRAASKTIEFLKEKKVQVKEIIQIVTSYNELVNNCSPIGEQACANLTKTIEEAINKLTPLQKD